MGIRAIELGVMPTSKLGRHCDRPPQPPATWLGTLHVQGPSGWTGRVPHVAWGNSERPVRGLARREMGDASKSLSSKARVWGGSPGFGWLGWWISGPSSPASLLRVSEAWGRSSGARRSRRRPAAGGQIAAGFELKFGRRHSNFQTMPAFGPGIQRTGRAGASRSGSQCRAVGTLAHCPAGHRRRSSAKGAVLVLPSGGFPAEVHFDPPPAGEGDRAHRMWAPESGFVNGAAWRACSRVDFAGRIIFTRLVMPGPAEGPANHPSGEDLIPQRPASRPKILMVEASKARCWS